MCELPLVTYPRITVVTPSFNQVDFIEATIASVLDQLYPNLEYIIVDGGSSDGSKQIIERFGHQLSWWCSEPDRGQAHAIRKGFDRATGEILCWLNSDDVFLPGALKAVGEYFANHPSTEVVSCGAVTIDSEDRLVRSARCVYSLGVPASFARLLYYGQAGIVQCATFWRKSAYDAVGGVDAEYRFIMDLDLFARLAKRRRFGVLRQIVACYRVHPAAKGSNIQDVHASELALFQRKYAKSPVAGLRVSVLRNFYMTAFRARRALLALRWNLAEAIGRPLFRELPPRQRHH